jgi:hypothetical protein
MNEELPIEIWYKFLKKLSLKKINLMRQINATIKELIKIVPINRKIKIKSNKLTYLGNCHTLDLRHCKIITDAGLVQRFRDCKAIRNSVDQI